MPLSSSAATQIAARLNAQVTRNRRIMRPILGRGARRPPRTLASYVRGVDANRQSSRIDEMLAAARARLERLDPAAAHAALAHGTLLVDIRSESHRRRDGVVPGSMWI